MHLSEFEIGAGSRRVACLLGEPEPGSLAADPALLLSFCGLRGDAIGAPPYDSAARAFVAAGHRCLSFDLPEHGQRVRPSAPSELAGFCDAFLSGNDPFQAFVADGSQAIDRCVQRGLTRAGRIYAYGISRGGYCALRLAAADRRVDAVAAVAPVTDWRALTEFAAARERPAVASLSLDHWAEDFVGRAVYLVIGNCDARVGTHCCARFASSLFEAEARHSAAASRHVFHVVSDAQSHALDLRWYAAAAQHLLDVATAPPG